METDHSHQFEERLFKIGFGLGPFEFRRKLENVIAEQIPLDHFKEQLLLEFPEVKDPPIPVPSIEYIYEQCFEMRVEKELLAKANQVTGRKNWHEYKKWRQMRERFRRIRSAIGRHKEANVEGVLRQRLKIEGTSITADAATHLFRQLSQLDQVIAWWDGLANQAPWRDFYRGYVWHINRHLQAKNLARKELRAEIIASAIRLMRAESKVSQASIERLLSREARKPKRFVFTDDLPDF